MEILANFKEKHEKLCVLVLEILANSAINKNIKGLFVKSRKILALMMVFLTNDRFCAEIKALASQLLVNLMYKSTAAIAALKNKQIIEEIETLLGEFQRKIEIKHCENAFVEDEWAKTLENLRIIVNIFAVDWL